VKRGALIALCLLVALPAAPALAKKKHKKKPVKLGPVVTVTATGNTATAEGQESTATATCPAGKQAVGGGFSSPLVSGSAVVVHTSFRSSPTTWTVEGQDANGSGAVTAYAYCRNASAGPVIDVPQPGTLSTSGETKTLAPACPTGTHLIGGGFQSSVTPDAVVFPQVNLATSPSTWTVTGVENGEAAITVTAHAYCLAKVAAPILLSSTGSGSGGSFASARATTSSCPAPRKPKKAKKGKKKKKKPARLLSAGGFSVSPANALPGTPIMVFGDSRVEGTGWLTSAVNATSSNGSFTVTSQGICV
jgi:hypothetical protein